MSVVRSNIHTIATASLSLLVIAAIVGGCTLSAPGVTGTTPEQGAEGVPTSPAVVQIQFDQAMMTPTVERAFSISPSVGTTPPAYAWSENGRTLTVTFPQGFEPNTEYTVRIGTDAQATNDVALPSPFSLRFTTGSGPALGAGPTTEDAALTFASDIRPVAEARCSGCHGGQMADYDLITSRNWVVPGKPDESPYYTKGAGIVDHGGGNVWKDKADVVRQWIAGGGIRE